MWEDAYSIDARLEKNRGVGVGFGMLPEGDQTLTITLHAPPDGWLIDESEPRDNSGDHAWQPADGITTDSATHVYTVIGVDPNDGHAVGFCGKLKKAVEGDGSPPTFDAAVADLDLDAEGVEDDDEATAPGGGLFVPRSMHKGADFPDTLGEDDQYATLTLSVRPKWAGPPNPEYVGTLTFDVTGDGIQLYDISVNPPKIAERSRSVPAEGLTVQYGVVTNDQATSPGDIGATFTWDSELQGGPATAVDHVRIVPYWVDLDVARLEGNTVVQSEEDTQGSITSIVGPNDNLDTYALNLPRVAISSIEVLAEFGNPNGVRLYFEKVNPAASPGKVRIIKNSAVWMTDSESSKELSLADLSQTFTAQATYGGGVDLRLVARISGAAVCSDRVRISAIPGAVPKPGRIVFVNPAATNHNPPYDDFLENASENLSDAVFVATSGDNVVVAREYTFKFSSQLTVQKSAIVLAGLAGRLISPPNPNPYPWTTDEMDWSQRLPHLSGQGTTAILYWPNVSDVQVAGFVFENANATRGAACRFDESSNVSILCSQFSDNQAPDGGAGIMWRFTHQSRVLGCLFLRNTQTSSEESLGGGAILLQGCNTSSVARCRFEDRNTAAHGGAGVCLYSCPNSTVLTSYFTDCHGKFGGGVLVKDALDPLLPKSRIITCVFKENVYTAAQPHHGGSGVYVEDASCLISGCDFVNNSHAGSGGAIACRGDSTIEIGQLVEIHSCHFTQNHADYCGGAIAVFGSAEEGLSCDPPAIWGGTDANII
ncbi:MAG: right-handed parallel beta-helix repeat-containing protein, partial [Patescibacteria group bacterium]|nr:right-handed parallel beta-helix repeat-containing protein [Patescibacteria group bacterium]